MLRRGHGFFHSPPPKLWWSRFWRELRRKNNHRWLAFTWQAPVWQSPSWRTTAWQLSAWMPKWRLSWRDWLHLCLVATALYFFSGWFGGLRAEPGGVGNPQQVAIWRTDIRKVVTMDLEEYLKGVVAAEMPANFHLEALKAQAVAARTYALYTMATRKGVPGHPEANLTTDPAIDQAWVAESNWRKRWSFLEYYWRWRKVSRAVDETRGLVLTYGGDLIIAAYHSDSGGVTEDSENYWTTRLPYLRSVRDPVPTQSPYTTTRVTLARTAVQEALAKAKDPAIKPVMAGQVKDSGNLIEVLERYPSQRVRTVRVGDKVFSGRTLREALGLRSNWFEVQDDGKSIEFTVHGNGHGVGMSQFGADAYARQGATYKQILQAYYTGVQISTRY